MTKVLGAVLILGASILLQQGILRRREEEIAHLGSLLRALRRLWQQIYVTLLPLPELLEREGGDGAGGEFFRAVSTLYRENAAGGMAMQWKKAAAQLPLRPAVKSDISALADSFDASEKELERAFEVLCTRLEEELSLRRRLLGEQGRIITAICVSCGLLVAVMAI